MKRQGEGGGNLSYVVLLLLENPWEERNTSESASVTSYFAFFLAFSSKRETAVYRAKGAVRWVV